MLTSLVFIVLILIIYTCIPGLLNLNKKCFMCYLVCLGVAYGTIGWIHMNGLENIESHLFKPIGFIVYFSLLSVATWSNVISFDLILIFRSVIILFVSQCRNISVLLIRKFCIFTGKPSEFVRYRKPSSCYSSRHTLGDYHHLLWSPSFLSIALNRLIRNINREGGGRAASLKVQLNKNFNVNKTQ